MTLAYYVPASLLLAISFRFEMKSAWMLSNSRTSGLCLGWNLVAQFGMAFIISAVLV